MRAIEMKKMMNCVAVSGALIFAAGQTMAMNQQATHAGKQHSAVSSDSRVNLTEGQVIKVLSTANNGEIKQAKTALPKLKTQEARNYAQMMITDHSANEKKAQALASRLNLKPQTSSISTSLQNDSDKMLTMLSRSATPDKDYMTSQVEVHRKVVTMLDKQLIPNAKNAELKNMLTQTRTAVAAHLKKAEQIVAKMK